MLDRLHSRFGQPVALGIACSRQSHVDAPAFEEVLGGVSRELESSVGEEALWTADHREEVLHRVDGGVSRRRSVEDVDVGVPGVPVCEDEVVMAVHLAEVCSHLLEDECRWWVLFHRLLAQGGAVELALRACLDRGADV